MIQRIDWIRAVCLPSRILSRKVPCGHMRITTTKTTKTTTTTKTTQQQSFSIPNKNFTNISTFHFLFLFWVGLAFFTCDIYLLLANISSIMLTLHINWQFPWSKSWVRQKLRERRERHSNAICLAFQELSICNPICQLTNPLLTFAICIQNGLEPNDR